MTWTLGSAEARAAAHASYKIPPRSAREDLRAGDLAKLIFVDSADRGPASPASGERMWVEIVAAEADRYRGRLRNSPIVIQDLIEDDLVEFGPEHVADWADGDAR